MLAVLAAHPFEMERAIQPARALNPLAERALALEARFSHVAGRVVGFGTGRRDVRGPGAPIRLPLLRHVRRFRREVLPTLEVCRVLWPQLLQALDQVAMHG